MRATEVEVTVAVPVKDRREQMLRCLDALLRQDHGSYEILVLDNGSSDGTAEACRLAADHAAVAVRVVQVPGPVGRVRNEGAKLARGRVLAFTDSDCEPEPQWLREGLAAFERAPEVGIVCGVTLPAQEPTGVWPVTQNLPEFTRRYETCNVFYRRDAFLASGGFDEDVGFGWEDTAAAYAVLRGGWRAEFAPGAVVRHDVTNPGFWWWVRRTQMHSNLPFLLRRFPELRRELLYARIFLRPHNARVVGALVGLVAGLRWWPALLLAAPYLWVRRYTLRHPPEFVRGAIYELAILGALLRGVARWRRIVL